MYCKKCGNELKNNKFCTKCGFNNDEESAPVVEETQSTTNPKKSSKPAVAGIIIVVVIFIMAVLGAVVVIFAFVFKTITSVATNEFIELSKYKVPSIYKVTGEKHSVCSYSFSNNTDEGKATIEYCNELSDEDLEEYVDYLIEEEDFYLYEGPYKYNLQKPEEDYVIFVLITDNDTITYHYVKGSHNMGNERIGV